MTPLAAIAIGLAAGLLVALVVVVKQHGTADASPDDLHARLKRQQSDKPRLREARQKAKAIDKANDEKRKDKKGDKGDKKGKEKKRK